MVTVVWCVITTVTPQWVPACQSAHCSALTDSGLDPILPSVYLLAMYLLCGLRHTADWLVWVEKDNLKVQCGKYIYIAWTGRDGVKYSLEGMLWSDHLSRKVPESTVRESHGQGCYHMLRLSQCWLWCKGCFKPSTTDCPTLKIVTGKGCFEMIPGNNSWKWTGNRGWLTNPF